MVMTMAMIYYDYYAIIKNDDANYNNKNSKAAATSFVHVGGFARRVCASVCRSVCPQNNTGELGTGSLAVLTVDEL